MFENKYFYHASTKKVVIAFGTLFNSIRIERNTGEFLDVPLSYAPTEHFIQTLNKKEQGDDERVNKLLPRMSFSFDSPIYDSERQGDSLQKLTCQDADGARWQFSPTPYIYEVRLNIWTKYLDDRYQIVEQILPYFTPDFNVTINDSTNMGIKHDVAFELISVEDQDTYESAVVDKRTLITTLTFSAKVNFYHPVENGVTIRQAIVNLTPNLEEEVLKEQFTATLDPWTALPNDDFSIIETHEIV